MLHRDVPHFALRWLAAPLLAGTMLCAVPAAAPADRDGDAGNGETARPGRVELDRPMNITVRLDKDTRLRGAMIAYDNMGFELRDPDREIHHVAWDLLTPGRIYAIHRQLLAPRDSEAWLELGIRLRRMEGGRRPSNQALIRVERLDADLADYARQIRREGLDAVRDRERAGEADDTDDAAALDVATEGPEVTGEIEIEKWGELSDSERQAAIDRLDDFARDGLEHIGVEMHRVETRYFLFYTDLPAAERRYWAGQLDRMHRRVSDTLGFERDRNVWLGKCLVLLFADPDDFRRFEAEVHGHPADGVAGRCWSFGSGEVHITTYRQRDRFRTAHVLIHEAVHGFLHRYRSPVHVPSWLNEGLADKIADDMIPQNRIVHDRQRLALRTLRQRPDLQDFFDAPQIQPWHYGIASSLAHHMIRRDPDGYVALIRGIKDGMPWRESLETHYGKTVEDLVAAWGEANHIRGLSID